MSTDPPLLSAVDVAVRHRGAVRDTPSGVSFDVRAGEAVLLLGPSGCGKSTFALTLNGLIPNDVWARTRGRIELAGVDASGLRVAEAAASVAMVFQDADAQIVAATVDEEVAFAPENLQVPASEIDRRVDRALEQVGLSDARDRSPETLSGGERQRLAIASAIAQGSALIVLDEPTANLDPVASRQVYEVLDALVAAGTGLVIVEHDLDEALRVATRVVVLDAEGRVALDGAPREILVGHADDLVRLGVWLPVAVTAGRRLRSLGWPLQRIPLTLTELVEAVRPLRAEPRPGAGTGAGAGAAPSVLPAEGAEAAHPDPAHPDTAHPDPAHPDISHRDIAHPDPAHPGRTTLGRSIPPALEAHALRVDLGARRVLDDVDIEVERGSFTALIGANGAGKTTLLHSLAGVVVPAGGEVRVNGQLRTRRSAHRLRRELGMVVQNPEHQFLTNTVFDEIALELRAEGESEDLIRIRVGELLDRFGLTEHADRHPFLLSGGQKRRLSVATALLAGAPTLLLDEPTYGQDRERGAELMAMITALHGEGTTILMSTHDLQLVAEHADRVIVMAEGRVLAAGPTGEVLRSDALERAGLTPPALAAALARLDRDHALHGVLRLSDLPPFSAASPREPANAGEPANAAGPSTAAGPMDAAAPATAAEPEPHG